MKSYVYKSGILNRVYNLIRGDCERRAIKVMTECAVWTAICDQLAIEHNGYNFNSEEVEILTIALEDSNLIEFCYGCNDKNNYYMI